MNNDYIITIKTDSISDSQPCKGKTIMKNKRGKGAKKGEGEISLQNIGRENLTV